MKIELKNDLTAEEYNSLRKSIKWDTKDVALVEEAIKNSIIVRKALVDDELAGMARVIGDGIYYLIVDVVVKKEFQNQGVGKRIIHDIVSEIENRTEVGGACSINLVSMKDKEAFYEKCGFKKIPEGYTGYGMIKRIKK